MESSITALGAGPAASAVVVGPLRPRFERVRRIAVLRGGGLGDLLFALPAMRSLAVAYPGAEITLLGSRLGAAMFGDAPVFSGPPHRVEVLPPVPGLGGTERAPASRDVDGFLADRRAESYDLAVQLHGGGRFSNPFLLSLGARHTIGTRTPDAARLERAIDYVYYQHEMLRALEVVGLAGAAPVALEPRLVAPPVEAGIQPPASEEPTAVIHPGATDPRRRWPVERFADVAVGLVEAGVRVVLVGDEGDRFLCAAIRASVVERVPPRRADTVSDTSGKRDLRQLAAVLGAADVVIGNDSGPRHLAQALGTATVSIYWFGNVINAGPLSRGAHRVHIGWTTHCPVCGRDCTQTGWTAQRCEHDVSHVAEVRPEAVLADALRLLEGEKPAVPGPTLTARRVPLRDR